MFFVRIGGLKIGLDQLCLVVSVLCHKQVNEGFIFFGNYFLKILYIIPSVASAAIGSNIGISGSGRSFMAVRHS